MGGNPREAFPMSRLAQRPESDFPSSAATPRGSQSPSLALSLAEEGELRRGAAAAAAAAAAKLLPMCPEYFGGRQGTDCQKDGNRNFPEIVRSVLLSG